MKLYQLSLRITVQAPLLPRATSGGDFGVDALFFRDASNRLAIPGTHVKGKLKESWESLRGWGASVPSEQNVIDWFGQGTGDANAELSSSSDSIYLPSRGSVRFPDSFPCDTAPLIQTAIRIAIDDQRGSAEDAMLLVEERPFPAGSQVTFTGDITLWAKDKEQAEKMAVYFDLGLRAVGSLGGNQAVGYGRLVSAQVEVVTVRTNTALHSTSATVTQLPVRFVTKDPVCVTEFRPQSNLFVALEILPGGALKGALASQLEFVDREHERFPHLYNYLSHLRISHARPAHLNQQPLPPTPLSIVRGEKEWKDAVFQKDAVLLNGVAPRFSVDWKDSDFQNIPNLSRDFPRLDLDRDLRVRTKIDRKKRRAQDEQLFAYESVLPSSEGKPIEWVANFGLERIPEDYRKHVFNEISEVLASGLAGVGKTKAHFEVRIDSNPSSAGSTAVRRNKVVITLRSDTLLGDPRVMIDRHSSEDLESFYRGAWERLSGGLLKLSHFFADQKLTGGNYLHRRFQAGAAYRPWFLTSAGSVFVFNVADESAVVNLLQNWQQTGVPLDPKVVEAYDLPQEEFERWRACPYVPENGFGEIAVNEYLAWEAACL